MQSSICHSCRKPLTNGNSSRNMFDENLLIKSYDSNGVYDEKWCMKLISGMELITGQKITKDDNFPEMLCEVCFQSIEAFINFRHQLLKSRDIFLNTLNQSVKDVPTVKSVRSPLLESSRTSETIHKFPGKNLLQGEPHDTPLILKNVVNDKSQKTLLEDLINVDDSSNASVEINSLQKKETEIKQRDHDIESEIDVVSGEDDEVLELDVEKTKNETVEISSTESDISDIDVCDYEPTGKKGNYSTISPPLRF